MVRSGRDMGFAVMAAAACACLSCPVAADASTRSVTGGPAYAQPFDAIPTASPDLLASLRGGLRVGGLDVEFAANVRTLVNGALVLESITHLTPGGTTTTQSNMPATGMDPRALSFVGGRGDTRSNAPPANLSGLVGHSGVVVENPTGITTALHRVTREQILGAIFTTASNQQIRQEINVEVTISNFGRFQDSVRGALFSSRLLGSIHSAK